MTANQNGSNVESATTKDQNDMERLRQLREGFDAIRNELKNVVIGQEAVVEELLIAIFARGHCILVGVPGLAKTLLVSTLSQILELTFKRIQFTPDLMPADITGTEIIQEDPLTRERKFVFLKGPLFANMILADEINRTPPKTQAALLEAMQEQKITIGGQSNSLPSPFFVLATQNPIEQEGTYPLPEAQLDRFMFMVTVGYPSAEEEIQIMKMTTGGAKTTLQPRLKAEDILRLQDIVRRVPVGDHIFQYAAALSRATRPKEADSPKFIQEWVAWGAGPRASQYLILGAKARAGLYGRLHVTIEDVVEVALPVLRHRIVTNYNAEAEGIASDDIVRRLLKEIPRPADPARK